MDAQLEKIRQVQKDAWNKSSLGWKKWDDMAMAFMKPMGDAMIQLLRIRDDDHILDVATGTGEPGLTMASKMKRGKVTATDLAEEMLAVAGENAFSRNINNFETVCCDVSSMPFEDHSFDAISCRLGFMFFPDMQQALTEMLRVLKPGGRFAASVWNIPEKNFWVCASMETMISMLQLNPPARGGPGMFRCAEQGLMKNLLQQAGLKNIVEKEVNAILPCDSLETYWSFISEVASPVAFSKAGESLKQQIKEIVLGKVKQRYPDGAIAPDSSAIVVYGEK